MERNRSIAVPEGLQKLLEEFVVACLRKQPSDCVTFAAEYFTDMANRAHNGEKGSGIDRSSASPNANDDDASDDELIERPPVLERRRTVYAEPYDPDDDPNLNERVVHPKSEQQRAWLRRTLDTIFFFRDLERERLEEMLDAFEFREVHASERVIQQGDDGDFLYIVFMGTLEAYKKDDKGAARLVKEYHGEGYFGELALLYNQPRAATVIAKTDAVLAALVRSALTQKSNATTCLLYICRIYSICTRISYYSTRLARTATRSVGLWCAGCATGGSCTKSSCSRCRSSSCSTRTSATTSPTRCTASRSSTTNASSRRAPSATACTSSRSATCASPNATYAHPLSFLFFSFLFSSLLF